MTNDSEYAHPNLSETGQVNRAELIRKMKSLCAGKHIFITAAGGYGKTVASSQWFATLRGNKTKIIADNADNVPGIFYKRLAKALTGLTGKADILPDAAISFDRLTEIVKALPGKGKRCYLIIDDMHTIKNEEIIRRLPVMFRRLPGYIHCCLISRLEIPPSFVATGLFGTITKDDLAFSEKEIGWLGMEKGIELSSEQVEELRKKTGGWVMYLLALFSGGNLPDEIMTAKTPSVVTKYIESQVWKQTGEETKQLLVRLAVPEEIDPGLCKVLTQKDNAKKLLERIASSENAFLSQTGTGKDIYRFHNIYREFLLEKTKEMLSEDEIRRLNDVTGKWHFNRGEYYEGARHYLYNRDHAGIIRCLAQSLRFFKETAHMSVEVRLNFTQQYIKGLSQEFIEQNVYLIIWCASEAFLDGNAGAFLKYMDMLYVRFPEIVTKHPALMHTVIFIYTFDFRVTLLEQCDVIKKLTTAPVSKALSAHSSARISSITQNLPFFHRSMRDHSEMYKLSRADLRLTRDSYGYLIGNDYAIMEPAVIAGIHYERGEMIEAMQYAVIAYSACADDTHPEFRFCAYMILAATLHSMGAVRDAAVVMERMKEYIDKEARFLTLNFKALAVIRTLREGDKNAAREWLDVNAYRSSGDLPLYQIYRHFTTLRSYITLGDYTAAAEFGQRLIELSDNYKRPLDQIESRILTAAALKYIGKQAQAETLFTEALKTAMPYGFTQSFVNEGSEILQMLIDSVKRKETPENVKQFASKITDIICNRHTDGQNIRPAPKLTKRQREMLLLLDGGMTYAQIAEKLAMPRANVKYHLLTAYKKIGAHNAREAILKAKSMGVL